MNDAFAAWQPPDTNIEKRADLRAENEEKCVQHKVEPPRHQEHQVQKNYLVLLVSWWLIV
jgi:hypothetical protein